MGGVDLDTETVELMVRAGCEQREHYIDPEIFDALVREHRKRIRQEDRLDNLKWWSLVLGMFALAYFVLHAFKAF